MGLAITHHNFKPEDYDHFNLRLNANLTALEKLFQRPDFGQLQGHRKMGCELELYLIDIHGRPALFNTEIQDALGDDQLTLELNRYNLEYNLPPVALNNNPLATTAAEISSALKEINVAAKRFDCEALPIGILPTVNESDFGYHVMTQIPRYEALTRELRAIRGGPFHIDIHGKDRLKMDMEDVTLEGANTSLQVHYQLSPQEFPDTFNALQLITPLLIAISANSPFVFGQRLWHETRIPLFKQSIDCRRFDPMHPQPARVNYGHSWVRESALEIFSEAVRLYRPLLPVCGEMHPLEQLKHGITPSLDELRLQQGSVWLWNRPVYDPAEDGHIRIEARALPAGPTIVDMSANIALLFGLMEAMRTKVKRLLPAMPFEYCVRNFYRAAESGLQAEMIWPNHKQIQPEYRSCADILSELIEEVPEALSRLGIDEKDYAPSIKIINDRLAHGQTGAIWQLETFEILHRSLPRDEALSVMLNLYRKNSQANIPVSEWELP